MIYVCIPSYDEAATLGLVLWKVRRVFEELGREYQLLVIDDGSTDETAEVLERYAKALPLTVVTHPSRQGYARSVEELLTLAQSLTDRPKRDSAVLMHADFSHDPEFLPEFLRRLDSGADLVVGEARVEGEPSRGRRFVRKWAPVLLRRAVRIPGVSDTVSGYMAFRLMTLRHLSRKAGALLSSDGWAANAELLGKASRQARRIEAVPIVSRNDLRTRESRVNPWETLRSVWRAARHIRLGPMSPAEGPAT